MIKELGFSTQAKKEELTQKKETIQPQNDPDSEEQLFEQAAQTFSEYKEVDKEEMIKYWNEHYQTISKANFFFEKENIAELKKMSNGERLQLLAITSSSIAVTPDDLNNYLKEFPSDIKAIDIMFNSYRGNPRDSHEFHLYGLSALEMADNPAYQIELERFREIAERRKIAPKKLFQDMFIKTKEERFGDFELAEKDFSKAYAEASKKMRQGSYHFYADQMFTNEYEKLDEKQKAKFLRECLKDLQYALVFEETFNSRFTKERVIKRKKASSIPDYTSLTSKKIMGYTYDPAHSMLFETYQPVSAYDHDKEYLLSRMNTRPVQGGNSNEYAMHKLTLAILNKLKDIKEETDENSNFICEFWNKNRNPIFVNAVAENLSNHNPNRAASKLLGYLRKEENKNHLTAVLYRLEFGQIDISENGVKYLKKMYDLEEMNNPDYFAQRLTARGDIGVFDENRVLQKHFNLGDLTSEEETVKPQVHEFTYQTLFYAQPNETTEQRQKREQYLKEFKENYFNFYDDEFFKRTGIRFNNLDFREQGWFLTFYKNAPDDKKEEILNFAQQYGEAGFKTFLALELEQDMGERILAIGEKLEQDEAQIVFNQFAGIVEQINYDTKKIDNVLEDDIKLTNEEIETIKFNLLKQGRGLLADFANEIDEGTKLRDSDFTKKLKEYSRDLTLTASVYKTLARERNLKPEDLKDINFEIEHTSQINDQTEIDEMTSVYEKNFKKHFKNNTPFRDAIIDGFHAKFAADSKTNILRYRKNDKLLAFLRIDDIKPGVKYFGSFNASLKGANIGNALLQTLVEHVGKENIIEAHVIEGEDKLLELYTKKFGFEQVDRTENYADTGVNVIKISRPADIENKTKEDAEDLKLIRNKIKHEKIAA